MKKQIFYLATAVLATGLAACSSDELDGSSDVKLASNQLAAFAPSATATRVAVNETSEGTTLKWEQGDAFGVYSSKQGDENEKFTLTSFDTKTGKGIFTAKQAVTGAKYAYYPYDEANSRIYNDATMEVSIAGGEQTWSKSTIKAPMFGTITTGTVNFTPLTAVLKVTVLNMPKTATKAVLSSAGDTDGNAEPLYGNAEVSNIGTTAALALAETGNEENTSITYTFSASDIADEMTFYYIVPAFNYAKLVFSLDDTYSVGYDLTEDENNISGKIFQAGLNASAAYIYSKTVRYTDDGTIEESAVTTINDDLAKISASQLGNTNTTETTLADIKSNPTFIIPTVDSKDDEAYLRTDKEITVTLANIPDIADGPCKITLKQDKTEGFAPAKIKVVVSNSGTYAPDFDIDLPNSTVTLAPASDATYANVTSNTAANTLVVAKHAQITNLTIKGGNVLVQHDESDRDGEVVNAKLEGISKAYIFYAESNTTATTNAANYKKGIQVQPESIYNLLKGEGTATLGENGFNLDEKVTVAGNLTIDLNGQSLSVVDGGKITVATSGSLTIKDSKGSDGKVTSALAEPTIVVDGGTLILGESSYTITVENTNESSAVAVSATKGVVNLVYANVKGDVNLVKEEGKTLTSTLTYGNIEGDITVNGATLTGNTSSANVTIDGDIAISNQGSATIGKEVIKGKVTVTGNNAESDATALTLGTEGGSITETTDAAITVSGGAKVTVSAAATISGKTHAVDVQNGNLTITGAAKISGTDNAINVVKGELNVNTGAAEISSDGTVINAVPEKDYEAVVILKSGTYTTTQRYGYVLSNHNEAGNAAIADIEINGADAVFNGDVISDQATYFITAGKFQNCNNLYKNQEDYVKYTSVVSKEDGYVVVSVPTSQS